MSLTDRIRWLVAPDGSRWKPMLMGLAVFAAAVGVAAFWEPHKLIEAMLLVVGIAAWFFGACGMVGYVRWLFSSELLLAKQDRAEREPDEN